MALEIGDKLPELRLESREGEVNLADRYGETPLVVAFMRHFG